jgi:hypothetical protein
LSCDKDKLLLLLLQFNEIQLTHDVIRHLVGTVDDCSFNFASLDFIIHLYGYSFCIAAACTKGILPLNYLLRQLGPKVLELPLEIPELVEFTFLHKFNSGVGILH